MEQKIGLPEEFPVKFVITNAFVNQPVDNSPALYTSTLCTLDAFLHHATHTFSVIEAKKTPFFQAAASIDKF